VETQLAKAYEPGEVESKWYRWWEQRGYFRADVNSTEPHYSIVLPPPNVTGSLHMGHALNITLHDVLVRWKRMKGLDVLWLPGTDHAGIATQNVVERRLAGQGLHRTDLGREKFEAVVWEWKEHAEKNILTQIRRLGCSCDWSRQRFTLDEGLSRAVREVFVRLYEAGLIYRGEYLVNWCPRCSTAISDLEVNYEPTQGHLWYLRYPVKDSDESVVVATTRPETMLGDTAVAVHPDDDRYHHLVGKTVILPLMDREIPVVADSFVEREFGTGVVKVTPGHDPNDFEAGLRHQLPIVKVIGEDAHMTAQAGAYAGLERRDARKLVVADLEKLGLIVKKENYSHNVGRCQRCETVIEPLVSRQWFVRVKPLAEPAIKAVEEQATRFVPDNYARVYFEWMNNIHDWCISRQLWWGHRIPAWYCDACGEMIVAREVPRSCPKCGGRSLRQESDVLDTWFSSALWPFSTLGWPDQTPELKTYYPTSVLVTGFDIIFFWVARMMMMGLRFMDDVPFKTVYINGLVRDEHGQKMSKSRGNIIDPLKIIDEYGTDAVRFTLSVMAVPGTDIPFSISRMAGYRAFCNKIWNAGRFLLMNLGDTPPARDAQIQELWESDQLELEHRWILGRLQQLIAQCNDNLEKFRFHEASNDLYHFFWHEFCDWYIELIKPAITSNRDAAAQARARKVALYALDASLRLLHPFIPFITEEIWQRCPHEGSSIMVSAFPESRSEWIDPESSRKMEQLQELIIAIRTARAENNIDPRRRLLLRLVSNPEAVGMIQAQKAMLINLAQLKEIEIVPQLDGKGAKTAHGVAKLAEFALVLDEALNIEAERQRLGKQIKRLQGDIEKLAAKLGNADFVQRAPAQVIDNNRRRLEDAIQQLRVLQEKLDELSQSG
jgi:valyl-tRNA synthetase